MIEIIHKAFNSFKGDLSNANLENEYTPSIKVQSTVEPVRMDFNDTFKHIHEQLKPNFEK